ncbi:MAG: FkbM family methyltransferase [Iphinoe sp. HA4291-MV1]|jgi:FkbM family methyltransferase|nr:FkbM family methyltransferase [Iphinoe sp. HA4291-MV1]
MAIQTAKVSQNLKYYSHPKHQQDRWVIEKVFGGKRDGFFVDAGAGADGIDHSNSYALESQLGWKGICVEPHPQDYEKVKQNRSCYVENVALWNEPTELTFTLNLNISGTSGVLEEMNTYNRNYFYPEGTPCQEIKVKAMPLADVLRKYNAPKYIDYLSMDIEGSEYRALKNFPFHEYSFGCMTIEKSSAKVLSLRKLLLTNGYKLVNVKGPDDFWVHPSLEYYLPMGKRLRVAMREWVQTIIRVILRGEA